MIERGAGQGVISIENTLRYLGGDVENALMLAERIEV